MAQLTLDVQMLPLRTTKSFLTYSVEKLEKDTVTYRASCDLWQDGFPLILPELLKFLRYVAQVLGIQMILIRYL